MKRDAHYTDTWKFDALSPNDLKQACLNKFGFKTKNYARDVASKIKREKGADMRAYRCMVCHMFHLTSTSAEEQPAIKSALRRRACV